MRGERGIEDRGKEKVEREGKRGWRMRGEMGTERGEKGSGG